MMCYSVNDARKSDQTTWKQIKLNSFLKPKLILGGPQILFKKETKKYKEKTVYFLFLLFGNLGHEIQMLF